LPVIDAVVVVVEPIVLGNAFVESVTLQEVSGIVVLAVVVGYCRIADSASSS